MDNFNPHPPDRWLQGNIGLLMVLLLQGLVAFCVYGRGLDFPLVFDDLSNLGNGEIFNLYGAHFNFQQRWLSYGSFALSAFVIGDDWWWHRALNIGLHALTMTALFGFLRTLLLAVMPIRLDTVLAEPKNQPASPTVLALLGSLLFAVHPITVYAVAYLVQRSTVMMSLFALLSLWAVSKAMLTAYKKYWLLAFVAYLCAIFSKEHAVLLPLVALALAYLINKKETLQRARQFWWIFPLFFILGLAIVWRYRGIIGKVFDEQSVQYLALLTLKQPDIGDRIYSLSILNQAFLFLKHGFFWLVPSTAWLTVDMREPFPSHFLSWPYTWGGIGFVTLCASGVYFLRHTSPRLRLLGFALLFPSLLFLTEFATVWIQDPLVLYKGYFWFLSLPLVWTVLVMRLPHRWVYLAFGVLACLFIIGQQNRLATFASPHALWNDVIVKYPASLAQLEPQQYLGLERAYNSRGVALLETDKPEEAIQDFSMAMALLPASTDALANRCTAYLTLGQLDLALSDCNTLVAKQPNNPNAYLNRAAIYVKQKNTDAALGDYNYLAAHYADYSAGMYLARAQILFQKNDPAAAEASLDKALSLDPRMSEAWQIRGDAAKVRGDKAAALHAYQQGVALDPSSANANQLAILYLADKQWGEALQTVDNALAVDATLAETLLLRAQILSKMNQTNAALSAFAKAIAAQPNDGRAYALRGLLLQAHGENSDALMDFAKSCQRKLPQGCALYQELNHAREQFMQQQGKR